MKENDSSPENNQFRQLLEASESYLDGHAEKPGYAYEPVHLPLAWLFRKDQKDVTLGYRRRKHFLPKPRSADTSLHTRISDLEESGLIRYAGSNRLWLNGWYGTMGLEELRAAQLIRRRLVLVGDERLYILKVAMFDGEGRQTFPVDSFTYSSSEGMIKHQGQSQEPLAAAIDYLSRSE